MYKKPIFLTSIIFLSFLQFTCISNANAMFVAVLKTNKARYSILNRSKSSSLPVRWHSTNNLSEAAKVLNAFGQSDKETIRLFLSSQSLENSISILDKKTTSYGEAINKLQSKLNDFTLIKLRDSLDTASNISNNNQQQSSKPEKFNQENLDGECKNFAERYTSLQDRVNNMFIPHISNFIKISASQNDLAKFESSRNKALSINEKLMEINQVFLESRDRRDYLYLQQQSDSASRSFFSEELQHLVNETKELSSTCNEKINILNFVVNSGNIIDSTEFQRINNSIQRLEPSRRRLQELETSNTTNKVKAQNLKEQLNNHNSHVAELEEYIKRFSCNNNINVINKNIEDKINTISQSILEMQGDIRNLKSFPTIEAKNIEALLVRHRKSIFHNMVEITDLRLCLFNSNLASVIEENVEGIREKVDNIINRNSHNISWSETLEEKLADFKSTILRVKVFLEEEENLIEELISTLTTDELKTISTNIQKLSENLAREETYFTDLQVEAHKSLSNHPNATENDFYNIAGVETIRILSIDGGGVRGLIPSMILEKIEARTERPIARQFDVMAGTSVGGLLTLALNVPNYQSDINEGLKNKASDLVSRAKDDAQRIFPRKYFWDPVLINYITSKLWTFFGRQSAYLEGKKGAYSTEGLEKICHYYLGDTLLRNAVSKVSIPVTEEKEGVVNLKIFNSRNNDDSNLLMSTVALRTSRAPLYFATKAVEQGLKSEQDIGTEVSYADGGVILNNPAWKIYHRISNPNKKLRFIIVSLGTGQQKLTEKDKKDTARKTIETILQSASNEADKDLEAAFSENKMLGKYMRINFSIDKVALNDSSSTTLDRLENETNKYIKSPEGEQKIEEIVSLLKQKRPLTSRNQNISEEWFKE